MSLAGDLNITHVLRGKITSLGTINAPDKTLSVDGASADSKATGDAINAVKASLTQHESNKENPHGVTKSQIGLGNVDNTADIDKPVSTAQATAIADAKKAGTDAQAALSGYVGKEDGKGLSSNDFTTEEKAKLAGIEAGANNFVLGDGTVTADKIAENAVRIRVTNVKASLFVNDTTYEDYPYSVDIPIEGATEAMKPDVTFGYADMTSGNFCPVAESYNGGVRIFANNIPDEITIPVIELWR